MGQQPASDAAPPRLLANVDSVLRHATVDAWPGNRAEHGPAEDGALVDGDQPMIVEVLAVEVIPQRRLKFEGGVPGGDALDIDPLDRGPVLGSISTTVTSAFAAMMGSAGWPLR